MNIDIPETTPLGQKITTVGLWMSGGADSALLCFLLAEKIKQHNLPVKILPMTVDYKRPFAGIAIKVREEIEHRLNAKDVFLNHLIYYPPQNTTWNNEELAQQFHIINQENIIKNLFQVLYSGITTNPPKNIQESFQWGILENVEKKRGEDVVKETVRHFVKDSYEFYEIKPFFNLTKQHLADIYREKDLLNSVFPLTRSCEKVGTTLGHCGECWWCEERKWAFARL